MSYFWSTSTSLYFSSLYFRILFSSGITGLEFFNGVESSGCSEQLYRCFFRTVFEAANSLSPMVTTLFTAHHFVSIKLTSRNFLFWCTRLIHSHLVCLTLGVFSLYLYWSLFFIIVFQNIVLILIIH